MQPGSVIYDLAAIQGGNPPLQKLTKLLKLMGLEGEKNILINYLFLLQVYIQKCF